MQMTQAAFSNALLGVANDDDGGSRLYQSPKNCYGVKYAQVYFRGIIEVVGV